MPEDKEIPEGTIRGPWRSPRQMLASQNSGGHGSIHDDATARRLGFDAGTIEGPTHFSQFSPLCAKIWGQSWFETGCLSAEYRNACCEGEEVQALMKWPLDTPTSTAIRMVKRNGSEVLRGTASVGPDHPPTALDRRLSKIKRLQTKPPLYGVDIGTKSERRSVRMAFGQRMGPLYPFSLDEKLEAITEPSPWYRRDGGNHSPWGRPIIPLEMISVLLRCDADNFPFPLYPPAVQFFGDQEIRLIAGPLFVGDPYDIEHEVVALSSTQRTHGVWIKTHVYSPDTNTPIAIMLLNLVSFKNPSSE